MKQVLLETIKIENAHVFNLQWHNKRLNKTRLELFGEKKELHLQDYITAPKKGLYRCRVLYANSIESVEYVPYVAKTFSTFKIVSSQIEYTYKYRDRDALKALSHENYDEIIIEKNGLLTDTSIANIAFYDGTIWLTPRKALLEGTTRARLLEEGFLKLKNIHKKDIKKYSHFALMNAMIGFQIQKSMNIRL
jgi:4-amino-4-deoxychorismate lyase